MNLVAYTPNKTITIPIVPLGDSGTTKGGGSDTARKHYLTNLSGDALISLAGFFIKEQNNDPLNTSNHQLMQTVNRTK